MEIEPISSDGLVDAAGRQIRKAILEGRLPQGSRLGETELSNALKVSRAPIREALLHLEQEGLVHSVRNRGKKVVELSSQDIEELVSLRRTLERLAWLRSSSHATDRDLDDLTKCVERMRTTVGRRAHPELVRLDIEFHDRVFTAADHQRLYSAWSAIKWQVALYLLNRRVLVDDYHKIIVFEHHQLIVDLRSGNSDLAASAIEEHIDAAYERLRSSKYFEPNGGSHVRTRPAAVTAGQQV